MRGFFMSKDVTGPWSVVSSGACCVTGPVILSATGADGLFENSTILNRAPVVARGGGLLRTWGAHYTRRVAVKESKSPQWFASGDAVFPAMLAAIDAAQKTVALEVYIFAAGELAERFRATLIAARGRGVKVRVLVDGVGSMELSDSFLEPLRAAGADVRVFNPLSFGRLGIRNHRKLLACDGTVAFIGGFNIAKEYEGDGVTRGWCDLGLRVTGAGGATSFSAIATMPG